MKTYSNTPVAAQLLYEALAATIENWPHGTKRVTTHFTIETDPKRGQRAVRVT